MVLQQNISKWLTVSSQPYQTLQHSTGVVCLSSLQMIKTREHTGDNQLLATGTAAGHIYIYHATEWRKLDSPSSHATDVQQPRDMSTPAVWHRDHPAPTSLNGWSLTNHNSHPTLQTTRYSSRQAGTIQQSTIADFTSGCTTHCLPPQAYRWCQSAVAPGESRCIIRYITDSHPVSVFGPLCENDITHKTGST